ncbi:Hpt domain-containing protein [Piscinibacter sakaiensis]|uniref:Hpt domain-containing protein n=1 Tax=Piscinibacter sakaiensis TaxID=1547922 RepID=UPI003AADCE14
MSAHDRSAAATDDTPSTSTGARTPQDPSGVAWVHDELRRNLEAAHKLLRRHLRESESHDGSDVSARELGGLRQALSMIHQAAGALVMVGLPAAARVLDASEAALRWALQRPARVDAALVDKIEQASFAVTDWLGRMKAGRPVPALQLFPQMRALLEVAGAERVHPADLWSADWQFTVLPVEAGIQQRPIDSRSMTALEQLTLANIKTPSPLILARISDFYAGVAAATAPAGGELPALWQLAAAVFEALAKGLLREDVFNKRLGSRLLSLLRSLHRGHPADDDAVRRLGHDLLFFCAQVKPPESGPAAPRLAAVRAAYDLDRQPAVDYSSSPLGRFDPALAAQAQRRLQSAKQIWSAVVAGELLHLGSLVESFSLLSDSLRRMFSDGDKLAELLEAIAVRCAADGAAPAEGVAMEVATALLYLEATLDDLDGVRNAADRPLDRLAQRIDAASSSGSAQPLEDWIEDLFRRVAERQTQGTVVQELRHAMTAAEQQLDRFFRDPADRTTLAPVEKQLQSMHGVLRVLGVDAAVLALQQMRRETAAIAADAATAPGADRLERLAANIGMLGFLFDMLAVQPALARTMFFYDAAAERLRSAATRGPEAAPPATAAAALAPESVEIDASEQPAPIDIAHLEPAPESIPEPEPEFETVAQTGPATPEAGADEVDVGVDVVDPELQSIFADEAQELLAEARRQLAAWQGGQDDAVAVGELRRHFHTLKGSARMVGRAAAGELAWQAEQRCNAWLAAAGADPASAADGASDRPLAAAIAEDVERIAASLGLGSAQPAADADDGSDAERAADAPAARPQTPGEPPAAADTAEREITVPGELDFDLSWFDAAAPATTPPAAAAPDSDDWLDDELPLPKQTDDARPLGFPADLPSADDLDLDLDLNLDFGHPPVPQPADGATRWGDSLRPDAPAPPPSPRVSTEVGGDEIGRIPALPPAAMPDLSFISLDLSDPKPAAPEGEADAAPAAGRGSAEPADDAAAEPLPGDAERDSAEAAPPQAEVLPVGDAAPVWEQVQADSQPSADGEPPLSEWHDAPVIEPPPLPDWDEAPAVEPPPAAAAPASADQLPPESDETTPAAPAPDIEELVAFVPQGDAGQGSMPDWAEPPAVELPEPTVVEAAWPAATPAAEMPVSPEPVETAAPAEGDVDPALPASWVESADADADVALPGWQQPPSAEAPSPIWQEAPPAETPLPAWQELPSAEAPPPSWQEPPPAESPPPSWQEPPPAESPPPSWPDAPPADAPAPAAEAGIAEPAAAPAAFTEPDAGSVAAGELADVVPPAPVPDEQAMRQIGSLSVPIALFNIFLNEAEELSRQLCSELAESAMRGHRPVPADAIDRLHALTGSSATVGYTGLGDLARELEAALQREQQIASAGGAADVDVLLFSDAAEEIRQLLHQFAAGFLRSPSAELLQRLADFRHRLSQRQPAEAVAAEPAADAAAPQADWLADIRAVDRVEAELFPIFEEEANDLLPRLAAALRDWARQPEQPEPANAAMRHLHTFKGGARLAGAMRLGELAHRLETRIEALTANLFQVDRSAVDSLLAGSDVLQQAFETLRESDARDHLLAGTAAPPPAVEPADATLDPAVPTLPEPVATAAAADAAASGARVDWSRFSQPAPTPLPAVSRLGQSAAQASVKVRASLLERMVNQAGEVNLSRARIEVEMGQMHTAMGELGDNIERLRQQLHDLELQAETQMSSRSEAARSGLQPFDALEIDRFTRLQELTRMIAESVNDVATVQRSLKRNLQRSEDELAAQTRLTRELQSDLLRTRMVEFDSVAERLHRVVRQAASESGKQAELQIIDGSIELDRSVLDRVTPALEHLLRNAVIHGIEMPEQRGWAGKPVSGQLQIRLHQHGNEVGIDVVDDGAGLDLARIRARAEAMGRWLADGQEAEMIFSPGFSTAERLTEMAGRGIGLDVVRNDLAALEGQIDVTSTPGQGCRFSMLLPLTTAMTQVLMLRCGELTVAVPATMVERVRRITAADLAAARADGFYLYGDLMLPMYWLGALLGHSADTSEDFGRSRPMVIVHSGKQRIALRVDETLGQQEAVIRPLGPQLSRLPGLVGMSMLASGSVALIYNPLALAAEYGALVFSGALPRHGGGAAPAAAVAGPLVLVVDDSLTVRRVTQRLLLREGYRVALAKDGIEALERIEQELPAVVLSDIEMPRMDGYELVGQLRSAERTRGLPVVMITSRIADRHRVHAESLGVARYLGKPYREDELLTAVADGVRQSAPGA